jgi:hypothetical protein
MTRKDFSAVLLCLTERLTNETTVHREDLLVDDGGNRKTVEAIGKGLPELDVVASFA